jgi:hypothetical protein
MLKFALPKASSSTRLPAYLTINLMNGVLLCFIKQGFFLMPVFSTYRKPWKRANPGTGAASAAVKRAVGGDEVNMVQQVFYNGHYGFAGATVQHVLEADEVCYSFTCCNDAMP